MIKTFDEIINEKIEEILRERYEPELTGQGMEDAINFTKEKMVESTMARLYGVKDPLGDFEYKPYD